MKISSLPTCQAAVVAAFFCVFNINVFATVEDRPVQYSASSTLVSKYLSPGMGVNLHDDAVVQSDLTASWKNFNLFVWASHDMQGKFGDSFGDEVDYGLTWSDQGFSLGLIYFDEPALTGIDFANDIVYSFAGYTRDVGLVSITGLWENYTVPFGGIYRGGNVFSFGLNKSFNLCSSASLSIKTEMSYGDGGFGTATGGVYSRNSLEVVWGLGDNLDLKLGGKIFVPIVGSDYRETDAVITIGLSRKF